VRAGSDCLGAKARPSKTAREYTRSIFCKNASAASLLFSRRAILTGTRDPHQVGLTSQSDQSPSSAASRRLCFSAAELSPFICENENGELPAAAPLPSSLERGTASEDGLSILAALPSIPARLRFSRACSSRKTKSVYLDWCSAMAGATLRSAIMSPLGSDFVSSAVPLPSLALGAALAGEGSPLSIFFNLLLLPAIKPTRMHPRA
jgi:hypothetical protein